MSDVKTLHYEGVTVTFVKISGTWLVSVKNLGNAIGYSGKGRRLVASASNWLKDGTLCPIVNPDMLNNGDIITVDGVRLDNLLKLVPESALVPDSGTTPFHTTLTMLSLQGASKVITKANVKGVKELRDRWEEITTALMNDKDMPLFIHRWRSPAVEAKSPKKAKNTTIDVGDPLSKVKKSASLCRELVDMGALSMNEAKSVITKAMNNAVSEMWPEAIVVVSKHNPLTISDAQTAVVATLATNGGLGLCLNQPVPEKWKNFKTAADLGKVFGKSSESVGHHIPSILEELYATEMRANKIADRLGTALDPVKFRNSVDSDTGLATVYNDGCSCIALYGQNQAGGFNWRNYWSPDLSQVLLSKLSEKYKIALPPVQPVAMPAPVQFNPPALPKTNGRT